ncbi:hypothetical protein X943_001675 [Babesia divergens]|uniref:Uncharacterized protein n=1 Tax=Babesia divergens TaxID=32595 RepID=A0AAD9GEA5_BABDI|nr:hypothetical protein X943_001675 [Babesia divergens]
MMAIPYITFVVFIGICLEGVCGGPTLVTLPSGRLRYDRKNATAPIRLEELFRRTMKVGGEKDVGESTKAIGDKVGVSVPSGRSERWDPYNGVPEWTNTATPRCKVHASYPYDKSPTIDITGVEGLFNSILVGYQSPHNSTRENKGSMFGWSTVVGDEGHGVSFSFNANYSPINIEAQPTSYCALIFQPPLYTNSGTLRTFSSPPRHMKRSLHSIDALAKLLKKKNIKIVTSCCFLVSPKPSPSDRDPELRSTGSEQLSVAGSTISAI